MKNRIAKLIDVKSIITLLLVIALVIITLSGISIDEKIFNLFSNVMTMVITYFFTKKSSSNSEEK